MEMVHMTAVPGNNVYIIGKLNPNAKKPPTVDAKRMAKARENIAQYKKKK